MKKAAIFLIEIYRNYLSNNILHSCRFLPSCSEYTQQAIEKKGFLQGIFIGAWRILRCNPLGKSGHDPLK
ncbi:MAG: membrane protein insertion efficiency factor YidD [Candidatus Omnitrophota bacterium]